MSATYAEACLEAGEVLAAERAKSHKLATEKGLQAVGERAAYPGHPMTPEEVAARYGELASKEDQGGTKAA